MGNSISGFSSQQHQQVLNPILFEELKENKLRTRQTLCENLQQHGYAIIRVSDQDAKQIRETREAVESFFFDKELKYKQQWELAASTDPLLAGRRRNRGYVPGKDKEYLKVRLVDAADAYPDKIRKSFKKTMKFMYNVAHTSLLRLGQGPDPLSPPYSLEMEKPSMEKLGSGKRPTFTQDEIDSDSQRKRWMDIQTWKPIRDFVPEGSSMSIIRYFNSAETGQSDANEISEVCDAHFDTGLVTMILVSEVPGLELVDQQTKEWIPLEKLGQPGDLVLIMGRKVQMVFNNSAKLEPTFHRVMIPKSTRRHSILFFCDLPAGPDKA